jgi:hypothetical protein
MKWMSIIAMGAGGGAFGSEIVTGDEQYSLTIALVGIIFAILSLHERG